MAFIAAFRDNEINPAHSAGKVIAECKATIPSLLNIELGPLSLSSLNTLVNSAFPATNTSALAEVVLKKTEGNPFFVLQFLKTIHHEGMLRFDTESQTWYWDLSEVQTICSTSNVVEFMVQTLSKLDLATQNVMSTAACLGIYCL
jgi:predicted ATPase